LRFGWNQTINQWSTAVEIWLAFGSNGFSTVLARWLQPNANQSSTTLENRRTENRMLENAWQRYLASFCPPRSSYALIDLSAAENAVLDDKPVDEVHEFPAMRPTAPQSPIASGDRLPAPCWRRERRAVGAAA
jgi:hypothetical protein